MRAAVHNRYRLRRYRYEKPLQGRVESMQQSSATPSLHLSFLGLRKSVACSQPYLAAASCIYSFWHGVIPTSYFIFTLVYNVIIMHNSRSLSNSALLLWFTVGIVERKEIPQFLYLIILGQMGTTPTGRVM